eukprot:jgi/Tetstr1/447013/TSEL_034471.t1
MARPPPRSPSPPPVCFLSTVVPNICLAPDISRFRTYSSLTTPVPCFGLGVDILGFGSIDISVVYTDGVSRPLTVRAAHAPGMTARGAPTILSQAYLRREHGVSFSYPARGAPSAADSHGSLGVKFLLGVIDHYSNNIWLAALSSKRDTITQLRLILLQIRTICSKAGQRRFAPSIKFDCDPNYLDTACRAMFRECGFSDSLGLARSNSDTNMYSMNHPRYGIYIVLVYVDDILVVSDSVDWIRSAKSATGAEFNMTDFGEAAFVLGMDLTRCWAASTIRLSQEHYTLELLEKYGMQDCSPARTPMGSGYYKDLASASDADKAPLSREDHETYRAILGSVNFLTMGNLSRTGQPLSQPDHQCSLWHNYAEESQALSPLTSAR